VASASRYAAAIRSNGTLWAWGGNADGQLGNGTYLDQPSPGQVGTATNWTSVATGFSFMLAVRADGTLWAWGDNTYGQLGTGYNSSSSQTSPVRVGTATTWLSVAAGDHHALALRADGTLWAWGDNQYGQAGTGTSTTQLLLTPTQVGTATTWTSVSAGSNHTLARRQDGTLWAWGYNKNGQLGLNSAGARQPTPAQVGTATWASVSAGNSHTLAVRQDGTLWAWGYNKNGQLGTGDTNDQIAPVQVGTATTWSSASGGWSHSLALRQDGTLWSWGDNQFGQLGAGSVVARLTPGQVGTATWQRLAAGTFFSAALRPDGTLWTWGENRFGKLGTGSLANSVPIYIPFGNTPLATPATQAPTTWQLAPNPAHGTAQLLGLPAGPVAGRLFDAQGRLVRTTSSATVELGGLAPGLYLLRASAGGLTRTLRLAVD